MAEKKDNDNDNEDTGQVHLVVRLAVSVRPHMGVLYPLKKCDTWAYFIP